MKHYENSTRGLVLALVATVALAAATAAAGRPHAPSVAPSGISVVAWDGKRLGTVVLRGGPARVREERFVRGARHPTLSPTSGSFAFVRYTRTGFDVFRTGTYGGWEEPLASVKGPRVVSLAYTPDGQHIAIASVHGIQTVSIRGVKRTIPLPAAWRGSTYDGLAFSPDGSLLAFSRTWGDGRAGTLRNELAVIRRDGKGARTLARNPDPFNARYRPTFSPDGERIAFALADGSLAAVAVAGGPATRLTQPPARRGAWADSEPVWAPDGDTVAFVRRPVLGIADVYLVPAGGGEPRRLTTTPAPAPGEPRAGSTPVAWSPDGSSLLAYRREELASVAIAGGTSTPLARIGAYLAIGGAYWNR